MPRKLEPAAPALKSKPQKQKNQKEKEDRSRGSGSGAAVAARVDADDSVDEDGCSSGQPPVKKSRSDSPSAPPQPEEQKGEDKNDDHLCCSICGTPVEASPAVAGEATDARGTAAGADEREPEAPEAPVEPSLRIKEEVKEEAESDPVFGQTMRQELGETSGKERAALRKAKKEHRHYYMSVLFGNAPVTARGEETDAPAADPTAVAEGSEADEGMTLPVVPGEEIFGPPNATDDGESSDENSESESRSSNRTKVAGLPPLGHLPAPSVVPPAADESNADSNRTKDPAEPFSGEYSFSDPSESEWECQEGAQQTVPPPPQNTEEAAPRPNTSSGPSRGSGSPDGRGSGCLDSPTLHGNVVLCIVSASLNTDPSTLAHDVRTLKAGITIVTGKWVAVRHGPYILSCPEWCEKGWRKLRAIGSELERPSVLSDTEDDNGRPIVRESMFQVKAALTPVQGPELMSTNAPVFFCGRFGLVQEVSVPSIIKTPNGGHFIIAKFKFMNPVCNTTDWVIGVLQGPTALPPPMTMNSSAVADGWLQLADQIARMGVRVIVGDLQRTCDPLIHALSSMVKTTIMYGRKQDLNPFCVLGGVTNQNTQTRSYDLPPVDTTHLRFPDFEGIHRIRVKKPRHIFEQHHKLIIVLEGQKSNRSLHS